MDESAEAFEVDNQFTTAHEEPSLGNGEPSSFAEKTMNWYDRHKPKIRVAVGVALVVGLVMAAHRHEWQGGERYDAEDIEGSEPISDPDVTNEPRQSALDPGRDPFLRRLPTGQQAGEAARERYRELTGNDLPPGYTLVSRWFYLSPDSDDFSEAIA
ncbi:hypothetical protein ABH926_010107 [Catenulispora sp. GP43]|uniref:hypothetical protein n=1 Tax=Catenulispora sp. GP43 TaxID=3156263 RepID=UPI00351637F3